jgi:hypothetical protein
MIGGFNHRSTHSIVKRIDPAFAFHYEVGAVVVEVAISP